MNKQTITVPEGIRFIGEWEGFSLPDFPCIIDKQITGCGFTEYCIQNPNNVILVSPRKILLENKEEQHEGEVLYARSGLEKIVNFEKDLTAKFTKEAKEINPDLSEEDIKKIILNFRDTILDYYRICVSNNKPCKILVTYDSFRHVKEALKDFISDFYVVIDEFQSIFTDSRFKSTTEIEFLKYIQDIKKLTFVSATPMMDRYLEMLDEFKDLPYYEMDWESKDPSRVLVPKLNIHSCSKGILPAAKDVIDSYLSGNFESTVVSRGGELIEVESREAVLYVNSVRNICDIISKNELTLDNTNVLCATTSDNEEKLRKAFKLSKKSLKKTYGIESCIGKVPTKDQPRKMFTICTRTVYLGADFYSDNARTFIFSDANIDSLSVDISLDLPQILGRQRLEENPWKNRADLYYKTLDSDRQLTQKDFDGILEEKAKRTKKLLNAYNEVSSENRHELAKTYQNLSKTFNYKDDYVAVNEHDGGDLVPTFNNLVMVSELRSFEVQQIDYKDRFRVFNALGDKVHGIEIVSKTINEIENNYTTFNSRMKYIYSLKLDDLIMKMVLDNLKDSSFSKYYYTISASRAGTLNYVKGNLEKEYQILKNIKIGGVDEIVKEEIYKTFLVGEKYSTIYIKEKLRKIYDTNSYNKTPKASDLNEYFELKTGKTLNSETGKWENGFEIIKQKGDD